MPNYQLLYKAGEICSWYLHEHQQALLRLCYTGKDVVTKCHRRYGKDTTILAYACQRATCKPNFLIRYGAPTLKQAYEISDFILTKIYAKDTSCKPTFVSKGGFWDFGNGSKMTLFGGADKEEVEKGRGVEANLIIISEYAFFKYRPTYLLQEVLSPQLLTTRGQKIIASTVPEDLTHPYVEQLRQAEGDGRAFIWTIADSLRVGAIDDEQHIKIIKDCGGIDSDAYKREYKCMLVPSSKRLIVPEAQLGEDWVCERERPEYYTSYTCNDLGLHDFSVGLFGYHDFNDALLYIEDEHKAQYTTTKDKATAWKQIEADLKWKELPRRYSDNDAQQLFDLNHDYGYYVTAIKKRVEGVYAQDRLSFAESVINKMRIGLAQGRIKIHPRCKFLISTLKYGIWNDRRTDFERSEDLGHFDAGICLAYLYDNVDWRLSKIPEPKRSQDIFYGKEDPRMKHLKFQEAIRGIYGKKRRRVI